MEKRGVGLGADHMCQSDNALILISWLFSHMLWLQLKSTYNFKNLNSKHIVQCKLCCSKYLAVFEFFSWLSIFLFIFWWLGSKFEDICVMNLLLSKMLMTYWWSLDRMLIRLAEPQWENVLMFHFGRLSWWMT